MREPRRVCSKRRKAKVATFEFVFETTRVLRKRSQTPPRTSHENTRQNISRIARIPFFAVNCIVSARSLGTKVHTKDAMPLPDPDTDTNNARQPVQTLDTSAYSTSATTGCIVASEVDASVSHSSYSEACAVSTSELHPQHLYTQLVMSVDPGCPPPVYREPGWYRTQSDSEAGMSAYTYASLSGNPLLRHTVFSGEYMQLPQRVRRVQDVISTHLLLNSKGTSLLSGNVLEMLVFVDETTTHDPPRNPVDECMKFLVEVFYLNPERLNDCMFYIVKKNGHVKGFLEWKTGLDNISHTGQFLTAGIESRLCFPASVGGVRPTHQFRVEVVALATNVSVRHACEVVDRVLSLFMGQPTSRSLIDCFFDHIKYTKGDNPWQLEDTHHDTNRLSDGEARVFKKRRVICSNKIAALPAYCAQFSVSGSEYQVYTQMHQVTQVDPVTQVGPFIQVDPVTQVGSVTQVGTHG